MPYFSKGMDLCIAYNMEEGTMESIQFEYLNLIAAYMLHALAQSQSMGKLLYAFKNVRNMDKFLEENARAPDGNPPILTRQTMAYAISLSISCVCLHANEDILKGRASAAYERAMTDFESMSDATWHSLLLDVLVRYGTHLTNPEGPAPSAPMLTKHQILQSDNARKEARAASAAAAAAAAESGGDSGGGGGDGDGDGDGYGDDAASAHGDEDEAAQPAAAKAAGSAPKGKPQAGGRKGPRTRTG
jgi:hypothetical protein